MGIIYKNGIKYGGGDSYIAEDKSLIPVVGTQTSSTGSWTGNIDIPHLYNGLTIAYFLPYAPSGNATLNLTLSDGSTTGPINCYYNTNRLTTHYAKGSNIIMTFWGAGSISVDGTATTDDRWIAQADYDSNSNTWRNIQVNGTQKLGTATNTGALNFKDGENTSISYDGGVKVDAIDTTYDFSAGSSIGYFKVEDNNGEEEEITPYYEVNTDQIGVLPLTFTAKSGTAADWEIKGNDDNGTENLFDIPDKSVTGVNDYYAEALISTDDVVSYFNQHIGGTFSFAFDIITEYSGSVQKEMVIYFADSTFSAIRNDLHVTITKAIIKIVIRARFDNPAGRGLNYTFNHFMTVKGSTAPDHYIPYQQGVGQRTENLFDCRKNSHGSIDTVVAGVQFQYANQSITLSQTANGRYPQQQILGENGILMLENGTQYYGKLYIENAPENANIYMLLHASTDGTNYTTITTIRSAGVTFTPNDDYTVYRWLFVAEGNDITYNNTVVKFAIVKGNTAPAEYVPYGYEIPISVNGTPQTFYIGDSPLTEGETVSKTSTGVDIELFEGENTVSTTLYNKPEMTINYPHQVDIDPYINSKIPTALKNPYALIINYNTTKSFDYDGSTAKSLSIKAGDNITLSGDTDGNITINGTANTWTALVGATSSSNGSVGYINAIPPKEGYNTKFFRADGTWAIPDYIPNTDEKVKQTNNTNNSSYRILLSNSANDTEETNGVKKSAYLLFNPNSKTLTTTNLSITKINDVTVGSTPKFTDTTYTFANGTNSFTVTPVGGTAQTVTVTPSITNNITGSGTSGYLAKFNGTNTITKGPQLGSSTTAYLRNDGTWATPTDTNTYRAIQINDTEKLGGNGSLTSLNLCNGTNTTVTYLTGGKVTFSTGGTDNFTISSNDIDLDRTSAPSSIAYTKSIYFTDKDDEIVGILRVSQDSDYTISTQLIARNTRTGSESWNALNIKVDKDGNPTYSVGSASAFRTAINVIDSASFAHDSTNNNIKLTLSRADSGTVTANIPKVSSSSSGIVPKGTSVNSQSQSTKFLREDGTWATPSYTTDTNTHRPVTINGNSFLGNTTTDLNFVDGTGISILQQNEPLSIVINHSNSITAGTAKGSDNRTLSFGGQFAIPTITYDAQGHITGKGTTTMTMPSNPNTDTKVNMNLATPADTGYNVYYPASSGNLTEAAQELYKHGNLRIGLKAGTSSQDGYTRIRLGNETASGTAGNSAGELVLYAIDTKYGILRQKSGATENVTHYLPATGDGTIYTTSNLTNGSNISFSTTSGVTSINATNTYRAIKINNTEKLGGNGSLTALNLCDGSNVTITYISSGKVTIAATNNKTSQTKWNDAGGTNKPLLMGNGFSDSTAGTYYIDNLYCSGSGVLHCQSCIEGSDKRLKDNIEILDNRYLELIKKLQPRRYKFKNDIENKYHIGFITQEIETELSKCNLTKEDFGTLTETGEDKMQGLAYTDFIPMLLLYIKDLEKQIKEIKEQQ